MAGTYKGEKDILETLSQLGLNMLPKAGQAAGAYFGGPVGSEAGRIAGSTLQYGLTPEESAYSGMGFSPNEQNISSYQTGSSPLGGLASHLGQELGMAAVNTAGSMIGDQAKDFISKDEEQQEKINKVIKRIIERVPKDKILAFLEARKQGGANG